MLVIDIRPMDSQRQASHALKRLEAGNNCFSFRRIMLLEHATEQSAGVTQRKLYVLSLRSSVRFLTMVHGLVNVPHFIHRWFLRCFGKYVIRIVWNMHPACVLSEMHTISSIKLYVILFWVVIPLEKSFVQACVMHTMSLSFRYCGWWYPSS